MGEVTCSLQSNLYAELGTSKNLLLRLTNLSQSENLLIGDVPIVVAILYVWATLIPLVFLKFSNQCSLFQANATSTFNILNEEGRIVAAAMLPQGA